MLKSTHSEKPLAPDWTEHRAPTGHKYYYNSVTKQSTYTRPTAFELETQQQPPAVSSLAAIAATPSFDGSAPIHYRPEKRYRAENNFGRPQNNRRFHENRRSSAQDRPKTKHNIPGCSPWVLVKTRLGRRFVHNPDTGKSFWKFPKEVIGGVVEFDIQERQKQEKGAVGDDAAGASDGEKEQARTPNKDERARDEEAAQSEEYDEVEVEEVTESEYEEEDNSHDHREEEEAEEGASIKKRPRTEHDDGADAGQDGKTEENVEFGEEDMAWQLAQMGESYELEHGEYGIEYGDAQDDDYYREAGDGYDDAADDEDDGTAGLPISEEEATRAFKQLLSDSGVDPYASWDAVVEAGKLVDDERYVLLPNMRTRKAVFLDWSAARIQAARAARAAQTMQRDPRVAYLALLHAQATPRLFWPEFKRKFKREPSMKDAKLADKDREKLYREHINRVTKRAEHQRKQDLLELLRLYSVPSASVSASGGGGSGDSYINLEDVLPEQVLADVRYISLPAAPRDVVVRSFLAGRPASASSARETDKQKKMALHSDGDGGNKLDVEEQQQQQQQQQDQKDESKEQTAAAAALRRRDAQVTQARKRQEQQLRHGKARLRDEEAELDRATRRVGRDGLLQSLQ